MIQNLLSKYILIALGISVLSIMNPVFAAGEARDTQTSIRNEVAAVGIPAGFSDGIITNFKSSITLAENGNASISETITIFFPYQKHGIYRWLPNEVILDTGKKLKQPITIHEVTYRQLPTTENGVYGNVSSQYSSSTSSGNYTTLKIGDPDIWISGAYEFKISYSMKRAVRYQDGYQELYLNITGDKWDLPILKGSVTIISPQGEDIRCYTGKAGSTQSKCTGSYVNGSYTFQTTTPNNSLAEGLTIAIKYPDNTFTKPSATESLLETLFTMLPYTILLLPLFIFFYCWRIWKHHGKDTKLLAIPPIFIPTKELKEESLTVLSSLASMKPAPVQTLAELVNLAEKGYLSLEYDKNKVTVTLTPEQQKSIAEYLETKSSSLREIIQTLTKNYSARTEINTLKNVYDNIQRANTAAAKEFQETPYITDQSEQMQIKFNIWGGLAVILTFLSLTVISKLDILFDGVWIIPVSLAVTAVLLFIFGFIMLKRTPVGDSLLRDLLGLKKYIKTAEIRRLEFFNDPKKMISHFEEILPFAIILGLDRQWTREFGPILEQLKYQPTWISSDIPLYHTLPRTYAAMATTVSSNMAKISTPPQSSSSSFGGGGGGFSGGGSGGGGGGSW